MVSSKNSFLLKIMIFFPSLFRVTMDFFFFFLGRPREIGDTYLGR